MPRRPVAGAAGHRRHARSRLSDSLGARAAPAARASVFANRSALPEKDRASPQDSSKAFKDVVEPYVKRDGIAPHPYVAYQIAVGQSSACFGKVLVVRQRQTPRASTPRSRTDTPRGQAKASPAGTVLGERQTARKVLGKQ